MKRLIAPLLAAAALATAPAASAAHPDYVFLFIGDGMGHGQIMAADTYLRTTTGRPDTTLTMLSLPVASLCTTYSASSPVTDSAAAGTAIATGTKTLNGMLGMAPDSTVLRSIARDFQKLGYGIGLVTTVAADDATPAAFYANVPHRGMYPEIGRQAAASGYEFIAGAGLRGFTDGKGNPTGIASEFDRYNVTIARGPAELARAERRGDNKIIYLSPDTIRNYRVAYSIEENPTGMTLTSMTADAIAHMRRVRPNQFFIMVEGGAIDHASHANDGGAVIGEVLEFDRALKEAVDFYHRHPDRTLIVVTADHETGGMSLGNNAIGYNSLPQLLTGQRLSKDSFSDLCKTLDHPTWPQMESILRRNFGLWETIPVNDDQTRLLRDTFTETFVIGGTEDQQTLYNRYNHFATTLFKVISDIVGLGWTTNGHSGNPVPVFAIGVGAELFSPAADNTQIVTRLRRACKENVDPPVIMR